MLVKAPLVTLPKVAPGAQLDTNTYLNQRRGVTGVTRRRETVYFVGAMLCALFNFLLILCLGRPSFHNGSKASLFVGSSNSCMEKIKCCPVAQAKHHSCASVALHAFLV